MVSRKYHPKTRSGCAECKRRRIKCDENRPQCNNCSRASRECQYSAPNAPAASALSQPLPCTFPALKSVELELLHHYYTTTCTSVARNSHYVAWLRDVAPQYAFGNDYVLSAMLSYTASHMSSLMPESRWRYGNLASELRQQAMALASPHLNDLRPEDCGPLFVCTTFLGLSFVAGSGFEIQEGRWDPIQAFLAVGRAFRGLEPLLLSHMQFTGSVEPKPDFVPPAAVLDSDISLRELEFPKISVFLRDFAMRSVQPMGPYSSENLPLYIASINALEKTVADYEIDRNVGAHKFWISDPLLLDHIANEDQVFEAIAMFYGVFLDWLGEHWWAGNLGYWLVKCLAERLMKKSKAAAALAMHALDCLGSKKKLHRCSIDSQ